MFNVICFTRKENSILKTSLGSVQSCVQDFANLIPGFGTFFFHQLSVTGER